MVLKIPTAYLYCDQDELAEFLLCWTYLRKNDKKEIGLVVQNRLLVKGLLDKKS